MLNLSIIAERPGLSSEIGLGRGRLAQPIGGAGAFGERLRCAKWRRCGAHWSHRQLPLVARVYTFDSQESRQLLGEARVPFLAARLAILGGRLGFRAGSHTDSARRSFSLSRGDITCK
jgi:hypothetical protein